MRKPSQTQVLRAVLLTSVLASVGGIVYAVSFGVAADGARGGAVAVAISFAALFAARSTPQDVLEMTDGHTGELIMNGENVKWQIGILGTAISTMIDSQRLEKKVSYLLKRARNSHLGFRRSDCARVWGAVKTADGLE